MMEFENAPGAFAQNLSKLCEDAGMGGWPIHGDVSRCVAGHDGIAFQSACTAPSWGAALSLSGRSDCTGSFCGREACAHEVGI